MNEPKRPDVIDLLGPLRRYARSLTRDENRADDLVQDTLVRAYERLGTFRHGGNLKGWLLSILHNTFVDERRRHKAEAARLAHVAETTETIVPAGQEAQVRLLRQFADRGAAQSGANPKMRIAEHRCAREFPASMRTGADSGPQGKGTAGGAAARRAGVD